MERELKYILPSEDAYRRLARALGTAFSTQRQRNHYLDTADGRMASSFAMVRVREQDGLAVLTFKQGVSQKEGYFEAEEYEAELTPAVLDALSAGAVPDEVWDTEPMRLFSERFGTRSLRLQGTVDNVRSRFRLACGEIAELDWTTFPGGLEEFELEVETERPREVEAELDELFAQVGLSKTPQTRTKYARFLASLGQSQTH